MDLQSVAKEDIKWQKISAENLDLEYAPAFLPSILADDLLRELEADAEYFSGDLAKVLYFGKWHEIPRQQVAYGDDGLEYKFSGNTIPALPWSPVVKRLRDLLHTVTGTDFNFVLVNRYRDGKDHKSEHRDNQSELDPSAPIATVSLGQVRDCLFKHGDSRHRDHRKRSIPPIKMALAHGSLLLMNPPTNTYWYHGLPPKKSCKGVRLNLTFRKLISSPVKK